MKSRLAALQQKLDGAIKAYREHIATEPAEAEAAAHAAKTAELKAAMDRATEAVAAERAAIEAERQLAPARTAIERDPDISGGEDRSRLNPRGGFNSFGEFIGSVFMAGIGRAVDPRLHFEREAAAPSTFGRESVGADGGYLVPPEFSARVYQHSLEEGSLVPLTDNIPVTGNSMSFPKDETTPWGTNGIRANWQGEGTAASQTKPALGEFGLRLKRLTALIPVTDELLQDASAVPVYVEGRAGVSIAFKTNDAFFNGDGNGKPLGFVNAGPMVTVAAEGSQTAATINAANVSKMFGRLPRITPKTRWHINHDAINQLPLMVIGQMPVWQPDFKVSPYGTVFGIPVQPSQSCATLGTQGDIYLVNWADYVTITKAGGIETATSMHLFFDANATAFRLTFRIDGQPWYLNAITPNNGSANLSGFVRLATRS